MRRRNLRGSGFGIDKEKGSFVFMKVGELALGA